VIPGEERTQKRQFKGKRRGPVGEGAHEQVKTVGKKKHGKNGVHHIRKRKTRFQKDLDHKKKKNNFPLYTPRRLGQKNVTGNCQRNPQGNEKKRRLSDLLEKKKGNKIY